MNTEQACTNMIKQQLRTCEILDEHLLSIIEATPKADFVPKAFAHLAYSDYQIPLAHTQVMMTPQQEGSMLQTLAIAPTDTILEIGTGTGYVTALLAQMGQHVISVDLFPEFTAQAGQTLQARGIDNVTLLTEDITHSIAQHGPVDVIAITAAMDYVPNAYKQSLAVGGRLFVIQGISPARQATLIRHEAPGQYVEQTLFETDILPLIHGPQRSDFTF